MEHREVTELVDKALGGYAKATSELIASELGGLRKEMQHQSASTRDLADEFKAMNGRLRDVCEWKAGHVVEAAEIANKLIDIAALKEDVQELKENDIKDLRDNMVGSQAIKKAVYTSVSIVGGVLGIVWVFIRIIEPLISKL